MGNQQGQFDIGPRLESVAEGAIGVAGVGVKTWGTVEIIRAVVGAVVALLVLGFFIWAITSGKLKPSDQPAPKAAEPLPSYADGYDYNSGLDLHRTKLDPAFAGYTNCGEYGQVITDKDPYRTAHFQDPIHLLNVNQVTSFIS